MHSTVCRGNNATAGLGGCGFFQQSRLTATQVTANNNNALVRCVALLQMIRFLASQNGGVFGFDASAGASSLHSMQASGNSAAIGGSVAFALQNASLPLVYSRYDATTFFRRFLMRV